MSDFYGRQELGELARFFPADRWPYILCPTCERAALLPRDSDSVKTTESAKSLTNKTHDAWEPEWMFGIFHGILHCTAKECQEPVAVVGEFEMDPRHDIDGNFEYGLVLRLQFATPGITLIGIPEKCPEIVRERVRDAAMVLWSDPGSAANRLRTAIEELLTANNVPKTTLARKKEGERRRLRLNTHARILKLRDKRPEASTLLEAVKWIGNDGSHDASLKVSDVLEGVKLLEHALHILYDNKSRELERIARKINAKKGLPRKR